MIIPKIRVEVVLDRNGKTVVAEKTLEFYIIEKAFLPIDWPSPHGRGFATFTCTPSTTIAEVTKDRSVIANALAEQITDALLDCMGASDTEMGYRKSTVPRP